MHGRGADMGKPVAHYLALMPTVEFPHPLTLPPSLTCCSSSTQSAAAASVFSSILRAWFTSWLRCTDWTLSL